MNAKSLFLLIFMFIPAVSHLQAQEVDEQVEKHPNIFQRAGQDATLMGWTVLKTYERPVHWKKKEWITLGVVLGVSALATTLDEPIYEFMQDKQSPFLDDLASVGDFLGQPENNYPVMLAVWGTGVIFDDPWLRDTGIMLFTSVTASGILQTISKNVVGRARPSTGEGPYSFDPFGGPRYHSFPSGHTMLSVAMSWILARQINFMPAKIIFYSLPVIVGASRIYEGAHWFSDIILGSALGIAVAESVLHIYPQLKERKTGLSLGPGNSGLGLVYRF